MFKIERFTLLFCGFLAWALAYGGFGLCLWLELVVSSKLSSHQLGGY